jgi:ATP-dependent DNA helicase RecG
MNRVVQGDVGSGKTIVGVIASLPIIWSGQKAVWLSPTQVLASQHYKNIKKLVGKNTKVALFTAMSKKGDFEKSDLIIGTHALIQKGVKINKLGLVVVDEQHRFGVKQREDLNSKNKKEVPHFLSLTATPIPRTLSHIIFGNCDISIIRAKPADRKKIKTFVIPESKRDDSYRFIDKLIEAGQKVFIVCPAIGTELDPEGDKKAVMQEAERIKATAIGGRNIKILHGQMKPKEKEESFQAFAFGKAQVLVSTSVVEVGVDVPEATAMVVEDAHNFGLAQLHQFRGRAGRSNLQSYCFCFSRNLDNPISKERLKVFVQNDDGFKLAQYDLKLRGPGALLGLDQSGFSGIDPIWLEDTDLLLRAKKIADNLLPIMKSDEYLYNKIKSKLKTSHLE